MNEEYYYGYYKGLVEVRKTLKVCNRGVREDWLQRHRFIEHAKSKVLIDPKIIEYKKQTIGRINQIIQEYLKTIPPISEEIGSSNSRSFLTGMRDAFEDCNQYFSEIVPEIVDYGAADLEQRISATPLR